MNAQDTLLPPIKPAIRSETINVRVTPHERALIEALAKQMNVTVSHFARYYLLQVVAFYAGRTQGGK